MSFGQEFIYCQVGAPDTPLRFDRPSEGLHVELDDVPVQGTSHCWETGFDPGNRLLSADGRCAAFWRPSDDGSPSLVVFDVLRGEARFLARVEGGSLGVLKPVWVD